jgi:hypothetical protein
VMTAATVTDRVVDAVRFYEFVSEEKDRNV